MRVDLGQPGNLDPHTRHGRSPGPEGRGGLAGYEGACPRPGLDPRGRDHPVRFRVRCERRPLDSALRADPATWRPTPSDLQAAAKSATKYRLADHNRSFVRPVAGR